MATMNISLPDDMKALVEARVRNGLYSNVSDYIRDLIRDDLSVAWEFDEEIATALEAGEASGWSEKTPREIIAEERAKFRSA